MKRVLLALASCYLAMGLVACGSSTVSDNGSENTTIAPLNRGTQSASTSTDASSTETSGKTEAQPAESGVKDQAAEEVSAVPPAEIKLSKEDQAYLDGLIDGGIDVKGHESEMIGAADVVCSNEFPAAVNAVAGQLVEQQRTTLSVEEVSKLITDTARKSYC